jgi:UDP-3-O-[3-hydroxymyristoyl] glucosamine N-acyltransferase
MTDQQKQRLKFAKKHNEEFPENKIHETVVIHTTAIVGMDGFGFAREEDGSFVKMPHAGNVWIEEGTELRAFVTVDRAVQGSTIIGKHNKIDHHVHIAHNAVIGDYNTFANGCSIEGSCMIGSFNTFGSNVTVQRKVKIGSHCRFGSGTVVAKDIPDGAIVVGNPGRILRFKDGFGN